MLFEKVKVGTILRIELSLPTKDEPIVAKGKVVWIEKFEIISVKFTSTTYDCGIEFVDISPRDQQIINHHIIVNIKNNN